MQELLNKAGLATQRVALALCGVTPGERIPTISALEKACETSRGNVQKALANLKEEGAISLEPHGQNGTTLLSVNYLAIARACGRAHLTGVMPLPYTSRYEGLATSLFTLLNASDLRAYIMFMRGSEARVQTLLDGSAGYAVMSRLAFDDYVARGVPIKAALTCAPLSYVGRHVLLVRDASRTDWTGARVGIDTSSVDQSRLTQQYFAHANVEYVPVQYTHIVEMLLSGELDVGIWNEDDVHVRASGLTMRPLGGPDGAEDGGIQDGDNTCAVIAVRSDDPLTCQVIRSLASAEAVGEVQRQVMEGKLPARY